MTIKSGWLVIDKPAGWTSHDLVARSRRLLKMRRIGHSGTLDPDATGVMVLGVGRATRLMQYLDGNKAYRATLAFGAVTDSWDASGQVLQTFEVPELSFETLKTHLLSFLGKQNQLPPMVSARSYKGKRLHQWAREGVEIKERPRREIEIFSLDNIQWENGLLSFDILCSSGTYIRTIAHELGQKLECGGYLKSLRRTRANGIALEQAKALSLFEEDPTCALIPVDAPLLHIEALHLEAFDSWRFVQGQRIALDLPEQRYRVYSDQGVLLGLGALSEGCLKSICTLTNEIPKPELVGP